MGVPVLEVRVGVPVLEVLVGLLIIEVLVVLASFLASLIEYQAVQIHSIVFLADIVLVDYLSLPIQVAQGLIVQEEIQVEGIVNYNIFVRICFFCLHYGVFSPLN